MYEEHPEYMIKKKKKSKSRSRSEKKKLKKSKKKSKKESNSDHTSRKNSIERQNMIAEWNETGIMNVGTQVIEMYNHQNLPAPVY